MAATAKRNLSATMAEKADIHDLYERSVQSVDVEAEFLRDTYRALRGRRANLALTCQLSQAGIQRPISPGLLHPWGRAIRRQGFRQRGVHLWA